MTYKNICLPALLCICVTAFSQPVIKRQATAGGTDVDQLYCMSITPDSFIIAGGLSQSGISREKTEDNNGIADFWIVKFDKLGKKQWDKSIGGSNADVAFTVESTSDGGFIAGGTSSSDISGNKTENSRGNSDFWLVKLDASGNIQWDKTIGGNGADGLHSVAQTTDGGYILGGYSESDISGEKTENHRGVSDFWIVKTDASGNVEWDKPIGGDYIEDLNCIVQTNDGGYMAAGYSASNISFEKTGDSRGGFDFWIVRLDASGNIEWDKTLGGSRDDYLYNLQQTTDNGYILGGYSFSNKSGEKSQASRQSSDFWIIKLNSAGTIEWDKTLGGKGGDVARSVMQTKDGGYIAGGYSFSDSIYEKTENSRGESDYWIVKLNKNGRKLWDKTIGGSSADACYVVKEVVRNQFIAAGYSNSGISGDKIQPCRGAEDYWIVKLNNSTPGEPVIAEITENTNSFSVYPNPSKNSMHINTMRPADFVLLNQAGNLIMRRSVDQSGDWDVSFLYPGMYYLKNSITGEMQKIFITK